jgi:hypothetical protein
VARGRLTLALGDLRTALASPCLLACTEHSTVSSLLDRGLRVDQRRHQQKGMGQYLGGVNGALTIKFRVPIHAITRAMETVSGVRDLVVESNDDVRSAVFQMLAMAGLDTIRTDGFVVHLIVDCSVMTLVDGNQEKHAQSVDIQITAKIEKCGEGQQGNLTRAFQKAIVSLQSSLKTESSQ